MEPLRLLALGTPLLLLACGADASTTGDALAAGWSAQLDEDEPDAGTDAGTKPGRFLVVAGGLEVRHGPNATLWHPSHRASGTYRLSADITHLDSGIHAHGAGLTFGGRDVAGEDQAYTYFLVRGDGEFLIKMRNGAQTADVVPWSKHDAVSKENKKGVAQNRLTVEVDEEETRFLVNGTEVHRTKTAGLHTDGQCGFRLVHDLHVRFGKPSIEVLKH